MHNVVGHGVKDTNGTGASYCTFANLNLSPTLDHTLVLRLLIPHLHAALLRIWHSLQAEGDNRAKQNIERLTDREREVLRWLVRGKSNPVIAQILSRSEFTIRNQVSRILQKLAVTNRNDAMIVATRIGHSFGIETPKEKQLGCHP